MKFAWKLKTVFLKSRLFLSAVGNVSEGNSTSCYMVEMLWRISLLFKSILCCHLFYPLAAWAVKKMRPLGKKEAGQSDGPPPGGHCRISALDEGFS